MLLIGAFLVQLATAATLTPELAKIPHEKVCEAMVSVDNKATVSDLHLLEQLIQSGWIEQKNRAEIEALKNERTALERDITEYNQLRDKKLETEVNALSHRDRAESWWYYTWTLSWLGTGYSESQQSQLDTAKMQLGNQTRRLEQLRPNVQRAELLDRKAKVRYEVRPGQFIEKTSSGWEIGYSLPKFKGSFTGKPAGGLVVLINALDTVIEAEQEINRRYSTSTLVAMLNAKFFTKTEPEKFRELESKINSRIRNSNASPGLTVAALQYKKNEIEVEQRFTALEKSSTVRGRSLAGALTAISFRYELDAEQTLKLVEEAEKLVEKGNLRIENIPALISAKLSTQKPLGEIKSMSDELLKKISSDFRDQVPGLVAAALKSNRTLDQVHDIIKSFKRNDLYSTTDAAGLAILMMNTGLPVSDVAAVYKYVRSKHVSPGGVAGTVAAIGLGQAISEWFAQVRAEQAENTSSASTSDTTYNDQYSIFPLLLMVNSLSENHHGTFDTNDFVQDLASDIGASMTGGDVSVGGGGFVGGDTTSTFDLVAAVLLAAVAISAVVDRTKIDYTLKLFS